MAITITEVIGSGAITEAAEGAASTGELRYTVAGTSSDQAVLALVFSTSPLVFNFLPRGDISISPSAFEVWDCTVAYKMPDEDEEDEDPDSPGFSFDTQGGTFHISHSLETMRDYTATQNPAPNFQGGINVSKDEVKGTDVIIPALKFTETHKFPAAVITPDFIKSLARNTGKTNNAMWRGFETGELLFSGCSGTYEDVLCSITYSFTASENIAALEMKPFPNINKGGHEVLWVLYVDEEDSYAGELVKGPRAAYVERVYESFDFNALGIADWPPQIRRAHARAGLRQQRAERNAARRANN